MSNLTRTAGIAVVVAFGLTGQAFAHAHLKSATPAAGSTVTAAPTELDLIFTEDVNLKFTGVKITGPDKAAVPTGDAMLMDKDTALMVPISGTVGAGVYTVAWHALSTDGHKTNGTYTFTVKP
jgi:methionine-rich copper-binding protein CopC